MKKMISVFAFLAVLAGTTLAAQEETQMFTVDGAAGLSFGLFGSDEFEDFTGIASILSIRGGFDVTLLYQLNDVVSVGPSLGLYAVTINGYTFVDVPIRLAAKVGEGTTFIQPFVGYYLAPIGFPPSGMEAGARGSLGGLFVDWSLVLGDSMWQRIAIGLSVSDLFQF